MSELGGFLEAVYGSATHFFSVRARLRHWRSQVLAEMARNSKRVWGRKKGGTMSKPTIREVNTSVWLSPPNRVRMEKHIQAGRKSEYSLVIADGNRWSIRDGQGHVQVSDPDQEGGPPGLTRISAHFDQRFLRELLGHLALESFGVVNTARRSCVRLRAAARPGARLWSHWLPYGADEYEFHADPERGVVLFIAARFKGQVYDVSEVVEVAFDEPLDDALFAYAPVCGEQIRPAESVIEVLSLDGAIARMPFTVLVPTRLPSQETARVFEVTYCRPRGPSGRGSLTITYLTKPSVWIEQSGEPNPELDKYEWEPIEYQAKRMAVSDAGTGTRVLTLVQDGTYVKVWSELDREQLIDITASLVPAHTT